MSLNYYLPYFLSRGWLSILLFGTLIFTVHLTFAQTPKTDIKQIVSGIGRYQETMAPERLFIHFDKPYYAKGDTIWLKAYLSEATSLAPSAESGLVYIELLDDKNVLTKRLMLPVVSGVSWGDIVLGDEYKAGFYTIRGYTNWMRNFNENLLFSRQIEVIDYETQPWLLNEATVLRNGNIETTLRLTGLDRQPYADKKVDISLQKNNRKLYQNDDTSDKNGILRISTPESDKIAGSSILVESKSDAGKQTSFPLNLNLSKNADVQFMPEGGYLVHNISSLVGFKAIGEDGNGIDVSGTITDQAMKEVQSFKSLYKGIGSITFVPQAGSIYTANVLFPDGAKRSFKLPEVQKSGTVLHVESSDHKDSLNVKVYLSPDLLDGIRRFYLIGQSRDMVVCAATISARREMFQTKIAKSIFHSGIGSFTLFDQENKPVNERQVFINHGNDLIISLDAGTAVYSPRDSVPVHLTISDAKGNKINGNFSLSVTDDSQVNQDSVGSNIISYMQLTSALKGFVETPGYYINGRSAETELALDNLLLTQGWIKYPWQDVFKTTVSVTHLKEPEFRVTGKISKLFDKTAGNMKVVLLSVGNDPIYKETSTDQDGNFVFTDFAGSDTMAFVLKVRNAKNKSIPATLTIDKSEALNSPLPYFPRARPWFVKGDTTLANYVSENIAHQAAIEKMKLNTSGETLNEVVITSSRLVKDSKNLNGDGADQTITVEEIRQMGDRTLLQVIQDKIKGFSLGYYSPQSKRALTNKLHYVINGRKVVMIIDGVNIETFFSGDSSRTAHSDFMNYYLTNLTAPEIKGVEVMKNAAYLFAYSRKFLPFGDNAHDYVFLEVTTYSGNGAFHKDAPGVAVYRPLPMSMPREFYRPRYEPNEALAGFFDRRSTIHWEPEITVANGSSFTSFYAADRPGTYTLIIQGRDKQGNLGYQLSKIRIERAAKESKKPTDKAR